MKSQSGGLKGALLSQRKEPVVATATGGLRRGTLAAGTNRNIARLILNDASTVSPQRLSGSSTIQTALRASLSLSTRMANLVTFSRQTASEWDRRSPPETISHPTWEMLCHSARFRWVLTSIT